ncbi:BLUF domain-containing protein [Mucilaginibacter limnophilus]|uniref:BLUF domain-containing protein n=1 Tax=Mucilaginibacter limnophilus TaxID=1932778 RepID=A0A3S2XY23_9SPHI|nr:BLUF domain-containing protein [Mucilaginibacter limnophilus]RVT96568.1 BLUF domain-containing protein [Mucilaginibacter limnophilus]
MYNIIYISTSSQFFDDYTLASILEASRENNKQVNVTGILLYADGTFLQVLEGEKEDVEYIFNKIICDFRHSNIIELVKGPVKNRIFVEWAMGFASANADVLQEFEGYVNPAELRFISDESHTAAMILLQSFVQNNRMN